VVGEVAAQLPAAGEAGGRPHLLLNMASTADGRASIGGRSGPIGDLADSAMLHGLRTVFDALLIGAQTARAERYAQILRDDGERRLREDRGLAREPLVCIVTNSLDVTPENVPLLGEPTARVAIITASPGSLRDVPASVEYVRAARDGAIDLAAAMRELREDHGVGSVLCEGGPTLATALTASRLLDELFLCFAPQLAGGGTEALRILAGSELQPPARLTLLSAHEHESQLFLRYGVS
jgi:riboflavin biosynthesis pyrimidine reductase